MKINNYVLKRVLMNTLFFCVVFTSAAEGFKHSKEIGITAGLVTFVGEGSPYHNFNFIDPGGQFFYKHNFPNNTSILRFNILGGSFEADESAFDEQWYKVEDVQVATQFFETSLIYEYNFLNYRDDKQVYFISPYLSGGLGALIKFGDQMPTYLTLPFGGGVKMILGKFNIYAEFMPRFTFTDELDGYNDDQALSSSTRNDWFYFTSIGFSYSIYEQICPDIYK